MMRQMNMSVLPVAALVAVCAMPSMGQVEEYGSPNSYQKAAIQAIRQANWPLALAQIDKCLELYGARYKELGFGDEFGWFYFQKGRCLNQMGEYDKAIQAYDDCYTKFPGPKNEFGKSALFGKGESEFNKGEYEKALATLQKFMKERRTSGNVPDARINIGQVYSYIAQCYFLLPNPDFKDGMDALSQCIVNRYRNQGVADSNIIQATMNMIKSSLEHNKTREVLAFLEKYPSALNIGTERLAPYFPVLINTTSTIWQSYMEAVEKNETAKANDCLRLIFLLSALVPDKADVAVVLKPMQDEMAKLGVASLPYMGITYYKAIFDNAAKNYDKQEEPVEAYALNNIATLHLNSDSQRIANAALQLMEDRYSMMKTRESNLFRLVVTSWAVGDAERGLKYGEEFKKLFPQSQYMGTINSFSIDNLLKEKKYDECLVEARKLKELYKSEPNNHFYILALHCEAAALYQLKRYEEAVPLLLEFIKDYKDTNYYFRSLYYLGSSYVSLRDYDNAIKWTSTFIKENPSKTDELLPVVYYERAFSYAQRNKEGDSKLCIEDCNFIINNFPDNNVYPMALNMKGNILSTEEGDDKDALIAEANECYKKAYEAAQKNKQNVIASESLYNLVTNYASEETPEGKAEAKKYYDLFFKQNDTPDQKNPFVLRMGVEGLKLYADGSAGFDEAAKRLQGLIVREGRRDSLDPAVEQAIGSYIETYFEAMEKMGKPLTQEQIKDHFYNFPGVNLQDSGLRTLLRTALIDVYQKMIAAAKPEQTDLKATLTGSINVFFQELENDFKPAELTTYTLLKLGSHLAKSSQPLRSLPYFDEILKRNKDNLQEARINKAIALGNSGEKTRVDEAISIMSKELDNERKSQYPNNSLIEEGQYYLTQFYFNKQDYPKALEEAKTYLDGRPGANRMKVLALQADAYAESGQTDEALIAYINIANGFTGRIASSAPATVKAMELYWKRSRPKPANNPLASSDKHLAWRFGENYLRKTRALEGKMTVPDRQAWRQVVDLTAKYGSDPSVMEEEKAIQQRKEAIKAGLGK